MNGPKIITGTYSPVTLIRADENSTPITVNVAKIATIEPIIYYSEEECGTYATYEPTPETIGSIIILDCGIAFGVKQTPAEIDEVIRETIMPTK